jgi:hypothetical protein
MNEGKDGEPIHCGRAFNHIGGELITAGQCFDALGRLMLLETDADQETLLRILGTAELIAAWRERLSPEIPSITAAQRHINHGNDES